MTRLLKLFIWTQGLLGGLLAVGLGVAVLALPSMVSIWERLAEQERDEKAAAPPTPSMWGFTKSPLPMYVQDFPFASHCVRLPSIAEHRAHQQVLLNRSVEFIARSVPEDFVASNRLLMRAEEKNFYEILACQHASREIRGLDPSDSERISISSPDVWDDRQKSRFYWAVWKWRLKWVGVPLAAILIGMGIAVVCLRGLLDVFREPRHLRRMTE